MLEWTKNRPGPNLVHTHFCKHSPLKWINISKETRNEPLFCYARADEDEILKPKAAFCMLNGTNKKDLKPTFHKLCL